MRAVSALRDLLLGTDSRMRLRLGRSLAAAGVGVPPTAIDTFRRKHVQPVGNVTARLETLAEASARERSVRGSRYLSFATQSAAKE